MRRAFLLLGRGPMGDALAAGDAVFCFGADLRVFGMMASGFGPGSSLVPVPAQARLGVRAWSACTLQQPCKSSGSPDRVPFEFTVPAQVLLSARIDYRFSAQWSLAVNLENILDKTYYQTTSTGVNGGHWYGAPRSFMATLRAKW